MRATALYISYDGALDPLGRSQVVPYIEGLAGRGVRYHLITFEKPERWAGTADRQAMEARLERAGVRWHPLRYHKKPPLLGTAGDIRRGIRLAQRLVVDHRVDLIHARSYPSALMAQRAGRRHGVPYVFDMRGFYPEERVDGGLWRARGPVFTLTKRIERDLFRDAAAVVTLTQASLPTLGEGLWAAGSRAHLAVIPTCVDLERFAWAPPPAGPPRLTYLGSVGTWYLLDDMMTLGRAFQDRFPGGHLEFVVNGEEEAVAAAAVRNAVDMRRFSVGGVAHEEVPAALARASATFFLIRPRGSKVASAATKFGESLGVGRPVLANEGVGDTADVIRTDGVGAVVAPLELGGYRRAVNRLAELLRSPDTAERCRRAAESRYALRRGVDAYARLYDLVLGRNSGGGA